MIERVYYRVKLNTDQIIYSQNIDIAQETGQNVDKTMSQKAITDELNKKFDKAGGADILEAKLNENIIKDPSKTYLVWKGNQFPNSTDATFKAPAGCTIDWGDGNVETFETASAVVNTHTYTDGIEYHLISLSNYILVNDRAFQNCVGLISLVLSDKVANIRSNAFNGCKGLTSITLPNSLKGIGDSAFFNCTKLTSITIPDSVTSIGRSAFSSCLNLKTIKILAENPPTIVSSAFAVGSNDRVIVSKSAINSYKSAAGWSTYADKIVYEVDSSDLDTRIPDTEKGKANGVATLDASGKVPSSQLPSYVDNVINGYIVGSTPFAADWLSLTAGGAPLTPEEGKIYVIISEGAYLNNSYRWSGTVYAPVGSPIAVVQGTGQSTTDVMSQKAVTDAINAAVTTALNTEV